MMTGKGQFGDVNMGGMFSTVKVREGLAKGDYKDPGHYQFPKGSMAYEYIGEVPEPPRQSATDNKATVEVQVRKPTGHAGH
jgi:manganese oxidase